MKYSPQSLLASIFALYLTCACAGASSTSSANPDETPDRNGDEAAIEIVSAGANHVLSLSNAFEVFGWGNNDLGQLMDGSTTDHLDPTLASELAKHSDLKPVGLAAGGDFDFTLVLNEDGTLWSIGHNETGQLGDGTHQNRSTLSQVLTFQSDVILDKVVASKTGDPVNSNGHALALDQEGRVWAWGNNSCGQLGVSTTEMNHPSMGPFSSRPVEVTALPKAAIDIVAVGERSYFLLEDRTVWAVGTDGQGQLGNGNGALTPPALMGESCVSSTVVPVKVEGLEGCEPTQIDAGYLNAVALCVDGSIRGWGMKINGGFTATAAVPIHMSENGTTFTGVKSIAVSGSVVLAIKQDGSVWGWGNDQTQLLGPANDNTPSTYPYPVRVTTIQNVETVVGSGWGSAYAMKTDHTWWAWGDNANGQLGIGTQSENPGVTPVQIHFE